MTLRQPDVSDDSPWTDKHCVARDEPLEIGHNTILGNGSSNQESSRELTARVILTLEANEVAYRRDSGGEDQRTELGDEADPRKGVF